MELPADILYPLQAACEQWNDHRVVHGDDVVDVLLFVCFLEKVMLKLDRQLAGFQIRQKNGSWLLTVKTLQYEVPHVVFVTRPNPTDCIRVFWELYESDRLHWCPDRYSWI